MVRFDHGSNGGGIATGNVEVSLLRSAVTDNTQNNCNPLNAISGCTD